MLQQVSSLPHRRHPLVSVRHSNSTLGSISVWLLGSRQQGQRCRTRWWQRRRVGGGYTTPLYPRAAPLPDNARQDLSISFDLSFTYDLSVHRITYTASSSLLYCYHPFLPSFRLSLVLRPFIFLASCCCDYFVLPVLENKGINLHILAYILIIRKHGTRVEIFLTTGRKHSD